MRVGRGSSLWLAKSNGRILGPYTDRQISDLLQERVLVPLDEICPPYGRWNCIRDITFFAKVIEDLRIRNLRVSADDTTAIDDQNSVSARTTTVSSVLMDDNTQEISSAHSYKDIAFKATDDPIMVNANMNAYTHSKDFIVQQKSNETSRWLWVITTVVVILSVTIMLLRKQVTQPILDKAAYEESAEAAREALERGEYGIALDNFKRAYAIDDKNKSIYLYLGILRTQIEDQSLFGRKIFEKIIENGGSDLKRVYTGLGVSYLKDGDLVSAEQQFSKALEIDNSFRPAIINIGATALLGEHWSKAEKYLLRAIREDSSDGAEVLMLAEVLINNYNSSKETRHLDAASRFLHEHMKQSRAYNVEIKIADAYLSVLRGDQVKAYKEIDKILDTDFILFDEFRLNLFVFRDLVNWSKVSQWCLRLTENLEANSHVVAFEGVCLLMSGDVSGASRKIDDALAQAPKDPLVLSAYGLLLQKTNVIDRMRVAVDKAIENDPQGKYQQPLRLKAWLCYADEDFNCAQKYLARLLKVYPDSLSAVAGMAQVELHNKNLTRAKDWLAKGLRLSDLYRPLLKLNKSISRLEDREKEKGD